MDDLFEGSKVLEMLAEMNLVEDFLEAVDSDNFSKAIKLMRLAHIDEETIAIVIERMTEADGSL